MTQSLLIELGCEELPANACRVAEREAGPTIEKLLTDRRLAPTSVESFVTPRRIAVIAEGVPAEAPAETLTHTGPPEKAAKDESGAWTKAGLGRPPHGAFSASSSNTAAMPCELYASASDG